MPTSRAASAHSMEVSSVLDGDADVLGDDADGQILSKALFCSAATATCPGVSPSGIP